MDGSKKLNFNFINRMEVIKRDGRRERVSFDKIIIRIEGICQRLKLDRINPIKIAQDTVQGLYNGITTEELDFYAANKCAEMILDDPQYSQLAAGLCISNLHKNTLDNFYKVTEKLYNNVDQEQKSNPLITTKYFNTVKKYQDKIQSVIDYDRDYLFDFFAVKTLERAYLIRLKNDLTHINVQEKSNDKDELAMRKKYGYIVERPQHLFMRVAIGIHNDDIDSAIETYNLLSQHYFTHASPTLYNAGSNRPQLSSCFLLGINDSLNDIFDTIKNVALISKWAGGIGIHISDIRCKGSLIRGTNGNSDGIIPLARVINEVGRYVNQGGRRNGAIALYIEPWHGDIYEFLDLRKNTGIETMRARDIFLALWIPDLFMKRVRDDSYWSLMCPDECPNLTNTYGEEFEQLYISYENQGKYKKRIKAKDLWFHILEAQIETGMPYMTYKDNVNKQSNQKNIGVIKSSNLCSEIVEYSTAEEIAVCNLGSICLPKFVEEINGQKVYNYEKLRYVSKVLTKNLNKVIDINYYPTEGSRISNMKHRPIGVGVQGLADTYCKMDMAFDSEEAKILNKKMFETIYYGCLEASVELAKKDGAYESFKGSPFSQGLLQYHLWNLDESKLLMNYDWNSLINDVKLYGTRNSLLTTAMPTASTSQIMNNSEGIEPYTTNLFLRRTSAGEFPVINKYLIEKLISNNLWTKELREEFLYENGSIQNIEEIPKKIKEIFKTAFEMKNKSIIQQAIERGPFIDQSQSLNFFSNTPDTTMLTSAHFYTWTNKLKTGMYYLRSQPAVNAIKFGLDPDAIKRINSKRKIFNQELLSVSDESDNQNDNSNSKNRSKFKDCESCAG